MKKPKQRKQTHKPKVKRVAKIKVKDLLTDKLEMTNIDLENLVKPDKIKHERTFKGVEQTKIYVAVWNPALKATTWQQRWADKDKVTTFSDLAKKVKKQNPDNFEISRIEAQMHLVNKQVSEAKRIEGLKK